MIRVIVEGLVKRFGPVAAVDGVSLEMRPGELTCLLGPAGAGKTTLARLVAGLDRPDDGEIYFDERVVHTVPPRDRKVGMVFRELALWPGFTVGENVAFPLRMARLGAKERRRKVEEALTSLRIDSLADRRPAELSPAQALRVALARSLVAEPELLILDDPLANLESRTREEAWDEIRRLREEVGVTTLWLTRSVPDALAYADRLAVLDLGRVLQAGSPQELYAQPADVFVARLLGHTNLIQGQVEGSGAEARKEVVVRTPLGRLIARVNGQAPLPGAPVTLSIRPESLNLGPTIPPDWNRFPATVERVVFRGDVRQYLLRGPGDWPISAVTLQGLGPGLREGQGVTFSVAPESVSLLPGKFAVAAAR